MGKGFEQNGTDYEQPLLSEETIETLHHKIINQQLLSDEELGQLYLGKLETTSNDKINSEGETDQTEGAGDHFTAESFFSDLLVFEMASNVHLLIGHREDAGYLFSDLERVFQTDDHQAMTEAMVDFGLSDIVANSLYEFRDIDTNRTIKHIIESGQGGAIGDYFIEGLIDHADVDDEIAELMRNRGHYSTLILSQRHDYFPDFDCLDIEDEAFRYGYAWSYAFILDEVPEDKRQDLQNRIITYALEDAVSGNSLISAIGDNLEKFQGLSIEVAEYLYANGYQDRIIDHPDSFACDTTEFNNY